MQDIVVGRSKADIEKFGMKGSIFIGRHYITMGNTHALSNNVYMDVAGAHVMFICGKRGGGKSYTMGALAEGFHLLDPEIKENLSVILLDTMGIYWTMKYPNHQDKELLEEWGLKPESIPVKIFTPEKYYHIYKEKGIPTDVPFTLAPSQIDQDDWCNAFKVDKYDPQGIVISNAIASLKKTGKAYAIEDIIKELEADTQADPKIRDAVVSMFRLADTWGVFSDHGTPLSDLAKGGQITVLDVSCYATMPGGWDVKALMVGLVGQRLFVDRMVARKNEEFDQVTSAVNFFSKEAPVKQDMPLVWLVIDEAHEFLPREGKVASTDALVTIMREGRQPGISLVLATQQPGKIHTDVMTQSDTVLSHRITAKIDVDALGMLMQSYMREGLVEELDKLPRVKGAGIIFDDANEKMYPLRIRPRFTWHGGSSPTAIPKEKEKGEFL
ncbi:MAG: ATP-binding protein [Nanoarchaeota archaeon]|nr:ATP-binding protein [Nanoarchaeota archaeon]